ncbi:hypothetical protein C0J52_21174 [Blattella germanica]|nr:hypothetical protein C0J52_21174 [Blattella germanica]
MESQFRDVILLLEKEICSSSSSNSDGANEKTENNNDVTKTLVLQEETFLIVDYKYKQGNKLLTRKYVGVATDVGAKYVQVKFLRPYNSGKNVLIFPDIPDEDEVPKDQISKLLQTPVEKMGKFIFKDNVL